MGELLLQILLELLKVGFDHMAVILEESIIHTQLVSIDLLMLIKKLILSARKHLKKLKQMGHLKN